MSVSPWNVIRVKWIAVLVMSGCVIPSLNYEGKSCGPQDACPGSLRCVSGRCATSSDGGDTQMEVAAAGFIACNPNWPEFNGGEGVSNGCRMKDTAALVAAGAPDAVLTLGEAQNSIGSLSEYTQSYDLAWGQFKAMTSPVPGVHDYFTGQAEGYFSYFGSRAGPPAKGYYSFDLGSWHLIALNGQCGEVGGCGSGSPQETWLREDLATHAQDCVLAYWDTPRFSSRQSNTDYDGFWRALYEFNADVVINAGFKQYERIGPVNADGNIDTARGLRQFIVGTGGLGGFDGFNALLPTTERAKTDSFGVLRLSLKPGAYDFQFAAIPGDSFVDEGSGTCH